MTEIAFFSTLATLIIGGFGVFAFMFQRLETRLDRRIDQLADRVHDLDQTLPREFQALRRDLAEEFRAQRAEVAAQVSAIANAIIASRNRGLE